MTPLMIESEANARFRRWKRLALEPRSVKREGAALLEGIHLLQVLAEAVRAGRGPRVEALILNARRAAGEACALVERLADLSGARVFLLENRLYKTISPVENGVGCMAEMALPKGASADDLRSGDVLYLDGVQDAGNAGTIIRTAAAAGFGAVAAGPGTALLWSAKALRAGMGAHFAVKIAEGVPIEDFRANYEGRIYAADAGGGEDVFKAADFADGPCCWVMGAEGAGVSERALACCDARYCIPISSGVESLNVSAAAAVCLFETVRRRSAKA